MRLLRVLVRRPVRLYRGWGNPKIRRVHPGLQLVQEPGAVEGRRRYSQPRRPHFLRLGGGRPPGPCGHCGAGGKRPGLYRGGQLRGHVPAEQLPGRQRGGVWVWVPGLLIAIWLCCQKTLPRESCDKIRLRAPHKS